MRPILNKFNLTLVATTILVSTFANVHTANANDKAVVAPPIFGQIVVEGDQRRNGHRRPPNPFQDSTVQQDGSASPSSGGNQVALPSQSSEIFQFIPDQFDGPSEATDFCSFVGKSLDSFANTNLNVTKELVARTLKASPAEILIFGTETKQLFYSLTRKKFYFVLPVRGQLMVSEWANQRQDSIDGFNSVGPKRLQISGAAQAIQKTLGFQGQMIPGQVLGCVGSSWLVLGSSEPRQLPPPVATVPNQVPQQIKPEIQQPKSDRNSSADPDDRISI